MGGHDDAPLGHDDGPLGMSDIDRFADKIYVSERLVGQRTGTDGGWSNPELIVGKRTFPWMSDEQFLRANQHAFIGSVGGPSVLKLGGQWHMIFAGSVSDPNICTGGHGGSGTPHGSCDVPWSFFAIFRATSPDGLTWTLIDSQRQNANIALQHSAVYYEPSVDEQQGAFTGLAAAHTILADDGYIHLFCEFWRTDVDGAGPQRNIHLRTLPTDLQQYEIWDGGTTWEPLIDGTLPAWVNADGTQGAESPEKWRGEPFALIISSVHRTTITPGFKYVLTCGGDDIYVAYSDDLIDWSPAEKVVIDVPAIAAQQKMNPFYFEEDGKASILFGSRGASSGQPGDPTYGGIAIYQSSQKPPQGHRRIVSS